MNIPDIIKQTQGFLQDQGYTDIYLDWVPDSKLDKSDKNVIMMMEYEHSAPFGRDGFYTGAMNRNVQLRVRRPTRAEGFEVITQLIDLLCRGINEETAGPVWFNLRGTPYKLSETANSVTMSVNLIAIA